jgi:hypothetical protein
MVRLPGAKSARRTLKSGIGLVKEGDLFAAPFSRQQQENVISIGRPDTKDAEIQAVGKYELELLDDCKRVAL